jgi:hypothetical protein
MLLMLINPSMYDLQDTLNTLQFGVKTGKIRAHKGLWGEVVGITRQHRLLIKNNGNDLIVEKSDCKFIAKDMTQSKEIYTTPSLKSLEKKSLSELVNLKPARIHFLIEKD